MKLDSLQQWRPLLWLALFLALAPGAAELLRCVDTAAWREEAALIPEFYERFGDRLPAELWAQHAALLERLRADAQDDDEAAPRPIALSA